MNCPACGQETSDTSLVANLTVCQFCARSLVVQEDPVRVATAEDLRGLSAGQVKALRLARPVAWRADVTARRAARG